MARLDRMYNDLTGSGHMAVDGGARGEIKAHESTYSSFISLAKIGTAVSVVLAAIVVLLIAN